MIDASLATAFMAVGDEVTTAVFYVSFPWLGLIGAVRRYVAVLISRLYPAAAAPPELAGLCVALVEDDPDIRQGIERILETWGCRCVAAASPPEVEDLLRRSGVKPDALIVDHRLVGPTNGIAVIAALRSAFGTGIPALLISGTPRAARFARPAAGISVALKPLPAGKLRAFLSAVRR